MTPEEARRLPRGQRLRLSAAGIAQGLSRSGARISGTLLRRSRGAILNVVLDGNSSPQSYHREFWEIDTQTVTLAPLRKADIACAQWLFYCFSIGFRNDEISDLEGIWWRYHDHQGRLIKPNAALQASREHMLKEIEG